MLQILHKLNNISHCLFSSFSFFFTYHFGLMDYIDRLTVLHISQKKKVKRALVLFMPLAKKKKNVRGVGRMHIAEMICMTSKKYGIESKSLFCSSAYSAAVTIVTELVHRFGCPFFRVFIRLHTFVCHIDCTQCRQFI